MKKTERNIIIALILIIYLLIIGDDFKENSIIQNTIAIACSAFAALFVYFLDSFLMNINRIKLWFLSNIMYRKKRIRVSMSYIYRIHINDKYLLVKNSKWDFYQPVGGVYKILPTDIGFLKDNFGWENDPLLPTNSIKKNDLRGSIPMSKLISFLDWFKLQKNREISHWREFYEELIRTNILSSENFPHIEYRFVGTILTPIQKCYKLKNWAEIISYDVFDLIANANQEIELINTQKMNNKDFVWLDEETILKDGRINKDEEIKIGQHTKWTIEMKHT